MTRCDGVGASSRSAASTRATCVASAQSTTTTRSTRARQRPDSTSSGTSNTTAWPARRAATPARAWPRRSADAGSPRAAGVRAGLGEDERAHPRAIQAPSAAIMSAPNAGGDRGDRGAAGRGQRVGDGVGVDHQRAERGEASRDGALAAADAAGQADPQAVRPASAPGSCMPSPCRARAVGADEHHDQAGAGQERAERVRSGLRAGPRHHHARCRRTAPIDRRDQDDRQDHLPARARRRARPAA